MRRYAAVSSALILGIAAAIGLMPGLLAAQEVDQTSIFAEGVETSVAIEGEQSSAFRIAFLEPGSYIPERINPAAMVVRVLSGSIAFRVQTPDVLVDPQYTTPQLTFADSPINLGANPNDGLPRSFSPGGDLPSPCVEIVPGYILCPLNPADFASGEAFVVLEAGYTIYLPPGSACFLCNVTDLAQQEEEPAEVLIWTTNEGFAEWSTDPQGAMAQPGTTVDSGLHSTRAWMLNPGSNCK